MLHFFSKIRRDLLADSKFFRYLKYAIGEILLVVIGILIALYINNRNEQRKEQERFDMILTEVEKELIDNIRSIRGDINRLAFKDSLCLKLFVDSVEFEDKYFYHQIISPDLGIQLPRIRSFQKLTEITNITNDQKSILNELNRLYDFQIDWLLEKILNADTNTQETLKKYDWFESYRKNQFDDDRIIDYFNNDTEYRNLAIDNYYWVNFYLFYSWTYDKETVLLYRNVHNYLDSLKIARTDSLELEYDSPWGIIGPVYDRDNYKHFLGKYDFKWRMVNNGDPTDSVIVSVKNDTLNYTDYKSGKIDWNSEIIPINKYRFRLQGYPGICHLEYDEMGDVVGLRYSSGPGAVEWWKKVR